MMNQRKYKANEIKYLISGCKSSIKQIEDARLELDKSVRILSKQLKRLEKYSSGNAYAELLDFSKIDVPILSNAGINIAIHNLKQTSSITDEYNSKIFKLHNDISEALRASSRLRFENINLESAYDEVFQALDLEGYLDLYPIKFDSKKLVEIYNKISTKSTTNSLSQKFYQNLIITVLRPQEIWDDSSFRKTDKQRTRDIKNVIKNFRAAQQIIKDMNSIDRIYNFRLYSPSSDLLDLLNSTIKNLKKTGKIYTNKKNPLKRASIFNDIYPTSKNFRKTKINTSFQKFTIRELYSLLSEYKIDNINKIISQIISIKFSNAVSKEAIHKITNDLRPKSIK